MNHDDIKIIWHKDIGCNRFRYWVGLRDDRRQSVRNKRKSTIKMFENALGPIGVKWHYHQTDNQTILKLNDERDFLFLLLKLG